MLYFIVIVILSTIAIQSYWNYKNYLSHKQQLINDVSLSLDNAIEAYYANLAEAHSYAFTFESNEAQSLDSIKVDSIVKNIKIKRPHFFDNDSLSIEIKDGMSVLQLINNDSVNESRHLLFDSLHTIKEPLQLRTYNFDSVPFGMLRSLTSKVIVSLSNDSLQLQTIDSLFSSQLKNKNIDIDYGLEYSTFGIVSNTINDDIISNSSIKLKAKSPYIHSGSDILVYFTNTTKIILKRMVKGLLISILLILAVISCLFYLLKIITHQKQIAEIKNDLISNITHEFKTPIATIGVALESIKDFNVLSDKKKTKSYLEMSQSQLTKLNTMVEKLLETATLDSNSINFYKEPFNLVELLKNVIAKHAFLLKNKNIDLNTIKDNIEIEADKFHLENALNNIIDNAIKYGGDSIKVDLKQNQNSVIILISDNGNSLKSTDKEKIFEKFYRIPKGNTHDIKGFGIGLYYSKKIIEKHNGTISLDLSNNLTTFKITIPNE